MSSAGANPANVYLFGMTVWSTIHRLESSSLAADGYGEIAETHVVPGGESGNSALVLARWGHRVKIAGPFLGRGTRDVVPGFFTPRGIDCSSLEYDDSYEGVRDVVLVAGKTRTVLGWFGAYFRGAKRWSRPSRSDVAAADIVGIDPFFGAEAVETAALCRELGKRYVTIDCPPDSELHRSCAANIVSNEYLQREFPNADPREILHRYTQLSSGLVVLTFGERQILYARGTGPVHEMKPFAIVPKCTLGAGDTFRGGVMQGVLSGWSDERVVRFAAATAACVCLRFPMAHDPPGLQEIEAMAARGA